MLAPLEQKLAVVRDVVLLLLRRAQIVGIDVLKPDEHPLDASSHRLLDETRDLVARRVDLDDEAGVDALLAQRDQPVEDRLPVAVASQIVVGDEKVANAVRDIDAHQRFDVVGAAIARLAALNVDDGAERAQERTAASGVEARDHAERAPDALRRHVRPRRAFEPGKVVQIVVDRLELARGGVAQHFVEPPLRLARVKRNAEVERVIERLRPLRQHRQASGDVEAADDDWHSGRPHRACAVHHPRVLIRLHPDEADHPEPAVIFDLADDLVRPDAGIGLVNGEDLDVHVLAKDLVFHAFLGDAEQAGERVGRQRRLPPLDDIALVVVMRRLDEKKQKSSAIGDIRHSGSPRNYGPPESCPRPRLLTTPTVNSLWPNAQSGAGSGRRRRPGDID